MIPALPMEGKARKELPRKVAYSSSGDVFFFSISPEMLRPVFHTLLLELKRLIAQENFLE